MAQLRSFNNYVDPILPNFDHLSPQEDNMYYPLLIWPFVDFLLNTYILFLFHVVIEWPLSYISLTQTAPTVQLSMHNRAVGTVRSILAPIFWQELNQNILLQKALDPPPRIIRPSYGPTYSPPKNTMGANRPRKLNNWLQIEQGWMIAFLQYGYSETISTVWAIENDRTYFRLSFWSMYELICKISIVRVCKLRFAK